ncbi:GAF domain-containing protein [Dolichospermum sp. LEGE 00240]|uniref:GAF domain-containing protein n=1 Tax=Dolichospermum sp. LEGE 00240 TaxID=1828603 RepID=UPI00187F0A63|nr:GAF domain-containing protein [Dolichospermum sp. LEGE 00240]MBE9248693.1 GAF domain-containing protein [Dolichospermum sp. LEGE 00240]
MTTLYQNPNEDARNIFSTAQNEEKKKDNGNGFNYDASSKSLIAQEFKIWRQRFQEITAKMRQVGDLEKLLSVTVAEIKVKLVCDRVLIYQFHTDDTGTVLAEARSTGWTPGINETLAAIVFGVYTSADYLEPVIIDDISQIQVTPYQKQLLEKFQVRASLSLPIFVDGKVWGLLVVHSCSTPRQWQETETTLLSQITTEITYRFQGFKLQKELKQSSLAKQSAAKVITKILQQPDVEKIFQTTTQEIRQLLKCDRVGVYRFSDDWSGQFVSEAVGNNWVKVVTPGYKMVWEDTHLQETKGGRYAQGETFVVNDTYKIGLAQCHIDILEQLEAKAYIISPIFSGEKLWGLLAAYQNTGAREWQDWEVSFLNQIGSQFGVAVSQGEYLGKVQRQTEQLTQITKQQKALTKIINRIQQSLNMGEILKIATQELRQVLQCDRVAVYQFHPDFSGKFVTESVSNSWGKLVNTDIKDIIEDTYLQETKGARFAKGETIAVNDIYQANITPCYLELLEQFEAKAYINVPIFFGDQLWGLLAAYQNSAPREWQSSEISFLSQVSLQFSLAKTQIDYLQTVESKSEELAQRAEQEKAINRIVNRIRQSLDVEEIFKTTTQEVRQALQCDRVGVYQFNPDWGGKFIAESVGNGWTKTVTRDFQMVWEDTHLQETQGGRYAKGETFVVNDIYQAGHAQCHLEILEQIEVKAYMIVPIFFEEKLWGLLAAYQNSAPRTWQPSEANFLTQIGLQFSLAKSQVDYLDRLRQQSAKIAQIVEQEKTFSKIVNQIRQSLTSGIEEILKSTTHDIRQLLKCDRAAVYKFTSDWGGHFVAESVAPGWIKLVTSELKTAFDDPCLQAMNGGDYKKGNKLIVSDIYQASFDTCYIEILEGFEAKAYAIVPILFGEKLWGLLAVYQNDRTRHWQESETNLLARIGDQLGLALQQTEFLQQLQNQSAKLSEAANREKAAKELLQQRSIQLLIALKPALKGDLTVRAPITEDEIGTIADAYNGTVQALQQIVIQVQTASQQVAQTSSNSSNSLVGLTHLAEQQSGEITKALGDLQQMLNSSQAVVNNAQLVQIAVQEANKTVDSGDTAMNETVNAIQAIRETVAQTSKKIKRLSESSQKISKVVNLISSFATQTNVLALNAAIEATRAGEYGKGFAVVADEVRSLSRQSAAATIEIEKLVQEIQAETGEVAVAMETGIQQVVEGTNLVNETRQNLNAIVSATAEISQLIERITEATQIQMQQSGTVTKSMNDVAEIANKTFGESQEIANVFQSLTGMAQDLLATASKFKVK